MDKEKTQEEHPSPKEPEKEILEESSEDQINPKNSSEEKEEFDVMSILHKYYHINENYEKFLDSKNKLMVIFRGINLEYFDEGNITDNKRKKLISDWNLDLEKKTILLPGRLTSWKRQNILNEALNILIEDYNKTNFQAIILGSDQGRKIYSKKLFSLVERYQLNQKVRFITHAKDMPVAYSVADIVVSSSIEPEAFGRVAVEAQAMKKPIVASDIGGSKETVLHEKSGILYKAGDARELAKVLNKLIELDKEALYSMGNEGRKNVTKKFNVEQMCQTTFNEYKKLLK